MPEQRVGELLDHLDVTADLDEGDLIVDALVILKVLQPDGSIALSIGGTNTRDWINQTGLLRAAVDYARTHFED
ncbi:hypothetical protein ACWEG1_06145 [Streptomyces bauhiniae]